MPEAIHPASLTRPYLFTRSEDTNHAVQEQQKQRHWSASISGCTKGLATATTAAMVRATATQSHREFIVATSVDRSRSMANATLPQPSVFCDMPTCADSRRLMFMILPILYRSFLEAPRDSNQYSRSPLQQDLHPDLLARCLRLCK